VALRATPRYETNEATLVVFIAAAVLPDAQWLFRVSQVTI